MAKLDSKYHKCQIKKLEFNMVPKIMTLGSANLVHRFTRFLDSGLNRLMRLSYNTGPGELRLLARILPLMEN